MALTTFTIETEQEDDGRWIAEVIEIPGAMVYGPTPATPSPRPKLLPSASSPNASNTAKLFNRGRTLRVD